MEWLSHHANCAQQPPRFRREMASRPREKLTASRALVHLRPEPGMPHHPDLKDERRHGWIASFLKRSKSHQQCIEHGWVWISVGGHRRHRVHHTCRGRQHRQILTKFQERLRNIYLANSIERIVGFLEQMHRRINEWVKPAAELTFHPPGPTRDPTYFSVP